MAMSNCSRCNDPISLREYSPDRNIVDGKLVCNACLVPSTSIRTVPLQEEVCIIGMVLDESQSMKKTIDGTIAGYNSFLEEQQSVPGKAIFYGCFFNHGFRTVYNWVDLQTVKLLDKNTYLPDGSTAMLDAIGRTITDIENNIRISGVKTGKIIVAIQTDGEENCSSEFSDHKINSMITEKESQGWKFVFLSASLSAPRVAHSLGIHKDHVASYTASSVGTEQMLRATSRSFTAYRVSARADADISVPKVIPEDDLSDTKKQSSKPSGIDFNKLPPFRGKK